ncbi:MAG: hypothetical protein R3A50_03355 [Saprospiraceae bacterium]
MKHLMILSLFVFLGGFFAQPLMAQKCQPNPSCKAVCAEKTAKAETAPMKSSGAQAVQVSLVNNENSEHVMADPFMPADLHNLGPVSESTSTQKCIPVNCDPSKCNPKNCDPKDCNPKNCDPSKCKDMGEKQKSIRI